LPRRPRTRQCKRCGRVNDGKVKECTSCGTSLIRRRFRMTKGRLAMVHALASRKGLDRELYELRLQAYGVASSKDFKRRQFERFVEDLKRLPDRAGLG